MEFILGVFAATFIFLSFMAVIRLWMKVAAGLSEILGISKLDDFIINKLIKE